jgi:hypothetical protein
MATSMLQFSEGRSPVVSVILADPESSLRSTIFASREGLAVAHKVDDAFPQQAVKVVINLDAIAPGDFVVRSFIAGSRRKLEILAMDANGDGLRQLLAMTQQDRRMYVDLKGIEFASGDTMINLPDAVIVATFKGK